MHVKFSVQYMYFFDPVNQSLFYQESITLGFTKKENCLSIFFNVYDSLILQQE